MAPRVEKLCIEAADLQHRRPETSILWVSERPFRFFPVDLTHAHWAVNTSQAVPNSIFRVRRGVVRFVPLDIAWLSYEDPIVSIWGRIVLMWETNAFIWESHGSRMTTYGIIRGPYGLHMSIVWFSHEDRVVLIWEPHGFHMRILWLPCADRADFVWKSNGFHIWDVYIHAYDARMVFA